MPQTRYKPNSDPISLVFTASAGAYYACVDDDPTSPNVADYIHYTPGSVPVFEIVELGIEPPTIPPTNMEMRIYEVITGTPGDVKITAVELLDNALTVAASYVGADFGVGISPTLHSLPLIYTPGSYDWSTARLRIRFDWTVIQTLTIYALDLLVGLDDAGPGGQRSDNASFFSLLVNP